MVRKSLLFLLAIITIYGCKRPISQYLCDHYVNEAGGVRSHYKYERYEDLTTPLPPGIEENVVYETLYSIKKSTGEKRVMTMKIFERFFPNGRYAWKDFPSDEIPRSEDFDIDKWYIGYYEKSRDGYRTYGYTTTNCGQFEKSFFKMGQSKSEHGPLVFETKTHYSYAIKVPDIPKEWLIDQQPDW